MFLPLQSTLALEQAALKAWRTLDRHERRCSMVQNALGTCIGCDHLMRQAQLAEERLECARSQVPIRHIAVDGALQRRWARPAA